MHAEVKWRVRMCAALMSLAAGAGHVEWELGAYCFEWVAAIGGGVEGGVEVPGEVCRGFEPPCPWGGGRWREVDEASQEALGVLDPPGLGESRIGRAEAQGWIPVFAAPVDNKRPARGPAV